MRYTFLFISVFLLSACVSTSAVQLNPIGWNNSMSSLEDLGKAPELNNTVWLNTHEPLRLANLRGNVILLEMWTFG